MNIKIKKFYSLVILDMEIFIKNLEKNYGPIDLTFINIGAYNFYPMRPVKDKSVIPHKS